MLSNAIAAAIPPPPPPPVFIYPPELYDLVEVLVDGFVGNGGKFGFVPPVLTIVVAVDGFVVSTVGVEGCTVVFAEELVPSSNCTALIGSFAA